MTIIDTTAWLEPYTKYVPMDLLMNRVKAALRLLPSEEAVTAILPSYEIGNDGITLARLFVISRHLLCDIPLSTTGNDDDFDFAALSTIRNFRKRAWRHEIKDGDVIRASFELCRITWIHDFEMTSQLTYAGSADGRDDWIRQVVVAVPVSIVTGIR